MNSWIEVGKKELAQRHGLIGKLVEPYPKPIRKNSRGIIS
jgi:hypothetical protein